MKRALVSGLLLLVSACGEAKPEFKVVSSMNVLMNAVLDPAADGVWESAGYDLTPEGERDLSPTTDEGWAAVVHNAAVIVESGDLLLLPGRVVEGPVWTTQARALSDAGVKAMAAAQAKDKDALFAAGGEIYTACAACHAQYLPKE